MTGREDPKQVRPDFLLNPLAPALDAGSPSLALAGGPLRFTHLSITLFSAHAAPSMVVSAAELGAYREGLDGPQRASFDHRLDLLTTARPPMPLAGRSFPLAFHRPLIMGIVNVTPDSFSDGGKFYHVDQAIAQAHALMAAGADLVDIGGESTRPGAKPVWPEEERRRIIPVIEGLAGSGAVISVDTRRAEVMAAALQAGAQIINDVSALSYDDQSLDLVREADVPVILMHALGEPATMQDDPRYGDVLFDVYRWLDARIRLCIDHGINAGRLLIDPGIGFGKSLRHNLDLINGLAAFHALGVPLLLGVSRKRFIGALSREEPADQRLPGSLAAGLMGWSRGVHILRVHDVGETAQALRVYQGLSDSALLGLAMQSGIKDQQGRESDSFQGNGTGTR
ncbi:dihydropteroate synthase [Iodidimonas nitroreducens]|uniref:dihydropteroate synthase n=1 Tax=Iodidimonas nitroreducens TaxID=1236968 RepID=A0A5A7NDG7_9PROT|nr:dihydropteroate synthase [Iodidimonas nitroreducens]GAK32690.1 dihydropteroate synthase [alpha proteobacterium Q-1]GER04976.1 dihydropteroate synthase [Iodidimonas nitroreducens]